MPGRGVGIDQLIPVRALTQSENSLAADNQVAKLISGTPGQRLGFLGSKSVDPPIL
ncbi:hypothetical protein GCM10010530_07450 [Kribbella aluminosa]